jgi:hypothetical protein
MSGGDSAVSLAPVSSLAPDSEPPSGGLDGDKDYEALLGEVESRVLYSAGVLREALREGVVCAGPSGVQGLLQQMDSIQTERIGADGQLVAYPLRVAGQLFYFGFSSRRDGVEYIEQLRVRLATIQARRCEQSALRAEAAARQGRMGRLGRRRTAVVDAVRAPDHNHQLLRLLRGGGGGYSGGGGGGPPRSRTDSSRSDSDSNGSIDTDDTASSSAGSTEAASDDDEGRSDGGGSDGGEVPRGGDGFGAAPATPAAQEAPPRHHHHHPVGGLLNPHSRLSRERSALGECDLRVTSIRAEILGPD